MLNHKKYGQDSSSLSFPTEYPWGFLVTWTLKLMECCQGFPTWGTTFPRIRKQQFVTNILVLCSTFFPSFLCSFFPFILPYILLSFSALSFFLARTLKNKVTLFFWNCFICVLLLYTLSLINIKFFIWNTSTHSTS